LIHFYKRDKKRLKIGRQKSDKNVGPGPGQGPAQKDKQKKSTSSKQAPKRLTRPISNTSRESKPQSTSKTDINHPSKTQKHFKTSAKSSTNESKPLHVEVSHKDGNANKKVSNQKDLNNDCEEGKHSNLPEGWIERVSKSHPDRFYYFNTNTGKSVWNLEEITGISSVDPTSNTKTYYKPHSISSPNHAQNVHKSPRKIAKAKRSLDAKKLPNTPKPQLPLKKVDNVKISHTIAAKCPSTLEKEAKKSKMVAGNVDLVAEIIGKSNVLNNSIEDKSKAKNKEIYKIPKLNKNEINYNIENQKNVEDLQSLEQVVPINKLTREASDTMEWEETNDADIENDLDLMDDNLATDIDMLDVDDDVFVEDDCAQIKVVDSNIYINNLSLVISIAEQDILAVPWTVLQELDGLKGNKNSEVAAAARKANRWLSHQVKNKTNRILFQKMSEVSTKAGADENADDRILLYCLYLKDLYGEVVCLITNDTNLSTKASVEEIEVLNESQLSISYKSQKKSLPQEERQLTTSSIPYIKPDDSKTPIVDRSISPSNIEGLTDNRDHKVNTLKLQCGNGDTDCDLVLTCLNHVWLIMTVMTQAVCLSAGVSITKEEMVPPNYDLMKTEAKHIGAKLLQYLENIGREFEALLRQDCCLNSVSTLTSLLNNFKSSVQVRAHEAWKYTPIIQNYQVEKFFIAERVMAQNGIQQLISIREKLVTALEIYQR